MALAKPQRIKRKLGCEKKLADSLSQAQLDNAAENARYVGSPYHRPPGSPMGAFKVRKYPQASQCAIKWTLELANQALKASIKQGIVSSNWDGAFPRNTWHFDNETLYEAVLSNKEQGEYHAYPLNEEREWPPELR
ncbi:MAG: hypothetical protein WCF85_02365 [Rhodospirillaceae bacterium]